MCIERQIATALKTANRQKHKPLNESYSLDKNIFEDDEEATYIEMLKSRTNESPENKYIDDESKRMLEENVMANLSAMEKKVLSLYLKGKKYTEIAIIVEKDEKSIDNALQRIKKKISKIVAERQ
jgi:RNA polymerase